MKRGREREGDGERQREVETYIAGLLLHLLLDGFLIVLVNVDLWLLLFLFLSGNVIDFQDDQKEVEK